MRTVVIAVPQVLEKLPATKKYLTLAGFEPTISGIEHRSGWIILLNIQIF